jgi:hypothetical protein
LSSSARGERGGAALPKAPDEARAGVLARSLSAFIFAGLAAIIPLSSFPYGSVEPLWTALFEALVFLLAAL